MILEEVFTKHIFNDYPEKYTYTNTKNRLHFSVKNPDEELPKIIRILSKSGHHIQSIESNKSSLEDVFLNLTGKGINE